MRPRLLGELDLRQPQMAANTRCVKYVPVKASSPAKSTAGFRKGSIMVPEGPHTPCYRTLWAF